jgi:hypothetical protein
MNAHKSPATVTTMATTTNCKFRGMEGNNRNLVRPRDLELEILTINAS